MGRHPIAAAAAAAALVFAVPFAAWLLLVRGLTSDDKPERDAALVMGHRLVSGRESLGTDVESPDRYVFRVVHQASADGGVAGTELATHIGVAVCLRAAGPSRPPASPTCTSPPPAARARSTCARPRPRSPPTAPAGTASSPRGPTSTTSRPRG
jgi:hypothetical protein